jgi:hypothetical protein
MLVALHVKYLLFLPDLNEISILWTDFRKILKYKISWKSVQLELSCCMVMEGRIEDRQTDRQTRRNQQSPVSDFANTHKTDTIKPWKTRFHFGSCYKNLKKKLSVFYLKFPVYCKRVVGRKGIFVFKNVCRKLHNEKILNVSYWSNIVYFEWLNKIHWVWRNLYEKKVGSLVFLPQQLPAFISRGATHHTDARDLYQRRRELFTPPHFTSKSVILQESTRVFHMPQSWGMGHIILLPLRRKVYWGFSGCPKNPTA